MPCRSRTESDCRGPLLYLIDVGGNKFARGADVVVTGGSFFVTAPVNSFFTLTAQ